MIDLDNTTQEPSEVFDKGAKKKKGFLSRLGFGGEVKNLGHVDDSLYDDEEDNGSIMDYDHTEFYADEDDYYELEDTFSSPSTRVRKNISSLLDDDDEQEIPPSTPTRVEGKKKGGLLALLDDDDDDLEPLPTPIETGDILNIGNSWDENNEEDALEEDVVASKESGNVLYPKEDKEEKEEESLQVEEISTLSSTELVVEEVITPTSVQAIQVPTYQQAIEEVVKTEPEPTETRADILASAGYVEIIEALTTKVMLHHEIPNISLESFGAVATTYEPSTLVITTFGKHKFAGNPLTDKQRIFLFLQIEELVEKARKGGNDKVILSATQQVQHEGIVYRTLLLSDDLLEDYMNAYNRTIMTNGEVASLTDLAVIITI